MRHRERTKKVTTLSTPEGATYHMVEAEGPGPTYGMGRFHIVFEGPLKERIDALKTFSAFKVFHALPHYLTFTEYRSVSQTALAAKLGITQGSVSRGMQELLENGIIEREGKGPCAKWRLSMAWGWRGNVESFHAERTRRVKPKKANLEIVGGTAA